MWTFQLSMPNCFAFQCFRQPFFVCLPFIHTLLFAEYFFVYTTLTLFKTLQWMSLENFTKIPGKKFKKTLKGLNYFRKQSTFTTLFRLSLKSLILPQGWVTFQMIQQHPKQCRNFLEKKRNRPDTLKFFQTFWKVSTQSGNFQDTLETIQTIWKVYIKFGKLRDNL